MLSQSHPSYQLPIFAQLAVQAGFFVCRWAVFFCCRRLIFRLRGGAALELGKPARKGLNRLCCGTRSLSRFAPNLLRQSSHSGGPAVSLPSGLPPAPASLRKSSRTSLQTKNTSRHQSYFRTGSEQNVPSARVFCSWKVGFAPLGNTRTI